MITDGELAAELAAALKKIRDNGPSQPKHGICTNLGEELGEGLDGLGGHFLWKAFEAWPLYSGDVNYPIAGGRGGYLQASFVDKVWSRHTKYGRQRWELLDFLIDYFDERS